MHLPSKNFLSGSIELKEMCRIMICLLELEGIGKVKQLKLDIYYCIRRSEDETHNDLEVNSTLCCRELPRRKPLKFFNIWM